MKHFNERSYAYLDSASRSCWSRKNGRAGEEAYDISRRETAQKTYITSYKRYATDIFHERAWEGHQKCAWIHATDYWWLLEVRLNELLMSGMNGAKFCSFPCLAPISRRFPKVLDMCEIQNGLDVVHPVIWCTGTLHWFYKMEQSCKPCAPRMLRAGSRVNVKSFCPGVDDGGGRRNAVERQTKWYGMVHPVYPSPCDNRLWNALYLFGKKNCSSMLCLHKIICTIGIWAFQDHVVAQSAYLLSVSLQTGR